jgi:drug/metabolite transporter (DMT)-like permease
MVLSLLWIPATLAAAAAQTARNAMQRSLTESIGTVGATQVRFLFGFPFALLFLAVVPLLLGEAIPRPTPEFFAFITLGSITQVLATALMLAAMRERSFAVVTAYVKTEPVQTALFGLAVLGDAFTSLALTGILVATAGVVVMSYKPGSLSGGGIRPAAMGIAAGAFFALAAIGFRGAVLSLETGSFVMRATTTLAWGLGWQTVLLGGWLLMFDRAALTKSFGVWRGSLAAGFMGALASQFWFIGFALTSAANVRTLALVEVLMAQAVSRRLFSQSLAWREVAGMALIVGGVALLLLATA